MIKARRRSFGGGARPSKSSSNSIEPLSKAEEKSVPLWRCLGRVACRRRQTGRLGRALSRSKTINPPQVPVKVQEQFLCLLLSDVQLQHCLLELGEACRAQATDWFETCGAVWGKRTEAAQCRGKPFSWILPVSASSLAARGPSAHRQAMLPRTKLVWRSGRQGMGGQGSSNAQSAWGYDSHSLRLPSSSMARNLMPMLMIPLQPRLLRMSCRGHMDERRRGFTGCPSVGVILQARRGGGTFSFFKASEDLTVAGPPSGALLAPSIPPVVCPFPTNGVDAASATDRRCTAN